jgi:repressor LexA
VEEPLLDGPAVVALLGREEVTVKRLYRKAETVRLRPKSGEHEDIVVPTDRVQIRGGVTHAIHPPADGGSGVTPPGMRIDSRH